MQGTGPIATMRRASSASRPLISQRLKRSKIRRRLPRSSPSTTASPGDGAIALTWTDNSTNEAGFKVERSTDGVNFLYLTAVKAGVTTYTNLSLTAGTTYYYRVRAYEGLNHSTYSNVASATTLP